SPPLWSFLSSLSLSCSPSSALLSLSLSLFLSSFPPGVHACFMCVCLCVYASVCILYCVCVCVVSVWYLFCFFVVFVASVFSDETQACLVSVNIHQRIVCATMDFVTVLCKQSALLLR